MSTSKSERAARLACGDAIAAMIAAAGQYCDAHAALSGEFHVESLIGDDGYSGPYMADILQGLIGLLSAEIGSLDGGTCDRAIRSIAARAGLVNPKTGDLEYFTA